MRNASWRDLVDVARWAPSPHNIQPWRVRPLDDANAELLCAPERLLPATDPTGRFTMVGFGIFVETLAIAARGRGLDLEPDLLHEPLRHDARALLPVGRLRLVPEAPAEPLDAALIRERRTSRLPYDGRPLPEGEREQLAVVARAFGHTLTSTSDPALVEFVLDLNRETLFVDLADAAARREVGSWLRFSAAAAERRADGFSPAALGFPGWLLFAFFHASTVFELPGVRHLRDALHARSTRGTRTIAWIQGPFERSADWFAAGRMLARLWLTMTALGLHLHPFGSIITNESANRRMRQRVPHAETDGTIWLIMRVGRSAEPPRSHRLEPDDLLVG